jgi:small-conductance mechanosensitive channel
MNNIFNIGDFFKNLFHGTNPRELLPKVITSLATVIFIFIAFNLCRIAVLRFSKGKLNVNRTLYVRRFFNYSAWILSILFVFKTLGIDSSAILGAAGIAGVAIGFAAQTSMSNLISGLFLISEKPFALGDVITIDNATGVVHSIDLLSVKLRTFDNLFIRIPNENIIKSNVTNITRFPIRRMDFTFTVPYSEDLKKLRETCLQIAGGNPAALATPSPFFGINSLDSHGVTVCFFVWFNKDRYWDLRDSILESLVNTFREQNIEIAAQKFTLNTKIS